MSLKNNAKFLIRPLIGLVAAAVVSLIMLLALSGVAAIVGANKSLLKIMNVLVRLAASGCAAYIIADGRRALLNSFISSLCAFFGSTLIFLLFSATLEFPSVLVDYAFTLAFCLLFSIIFVNFKKTSVN